MHGAPLPEAGAGHRRHRQDCSAWVALSRTSTPHPTCSRGIPESVPGVAERGATGALAGGYLGRDNDGSGLRAGAQRGGPGGGNPRIHGRCGQGNAYTDYSTHCIYSSSNTPDAISRYGELVRAGFPSIKIFTTDTKPPEGRIPISLVAKLDMGRLYDLMTQIQRHDGALAVHGSDDEITMYNYLTAHERGRWDWHNAHLIHSNVAEELAFRNVTRLAKKTGVGMYFVHVTAHEGLEAIEEARSDGRPVYGEVLTLALSFECSRYMEEDGMKYHTFPSLKFEEDRLELWKGLMKDDLAFTATDSGFTTYHGQDCGSERAGPSGWEHRHRDPDGGRVHGRGGETGDVAGAVSST